MREKLIYILGAVAAILFVRNLYVILNVLPDEAQQGAMYRIMFFHIPAWWTAMLAATIACYTNVAYLVTGKLKYDAVSVSLTEVQLPILFTGLTTGMIWGRIIWGIWWTWDARLTSALVYVLLCVADTLFCAMESSIRRSAPRSRPCFPCLPTPTFRSSGFRSACGARSIPRPWSCPRRCGTRLCSGTGWR